MFALHRRPSAVGEHRHAPRKLARHRIEGHDVPNAWHGECLAVVDARHLAGKRRTARDDRDEHAGHLDIDAEGCLSRDLGRRIEPRRVTSEETKRPWILEDE